MTPWDLIFYGATAITFIGIIVASRKARRERRDADHNSTAARRDTDAGTAVDRSDPGGTGGA